MQNDYTTKEQRLGKMEKKDGAFKLALKAFLIVGFMYLLAYLTIGQN